jgi:hypothetical protein
MEKLIDRQIHEPALVHTSDVVGPLKTWHSSAAGDPFFRNPLEHLLQRLDLHAAGAAEHSPLRVKGACGLPRSSCPILLPRVIRWIATRPILRVTLFPAQPATGERQSAGR